MREWLRAWFFRSARRAARTDEGRRIVLEEVLPGRGALSPRLPSFLVGVPDVRYFSLLPWARADESWFREQEIAAERRMDEFFAAVLGAGRMRLAPGES